MNLLKKVKNISLPSRRDGQDPSPVARNTDSVEPRPPVAVAPEAPKEVGASTAPLPFLKLAARPSPDGASAAVSDAVAPAPPKGEGLSPSPLSLSLGPELAPAGQGKAKAPASGDDMLSLFSDQEESTSDMHRLAMSLAEVEVRQLAQECRDVAAELKRRVAETRV